MCLGDVVGIQVPNAEGLKWNSNCGGRKKRGKYESLSKPSSVVRGMQERGKSKMTRSFQSRVIWKLSISLMKWSLTYLPRPPWTSTFDHRVIWRSVFRVVTRTLDWELDLLLPLPMTGYPLGIKLLTSLGSNLFTINMYGWLIFSSGDSLFWKSIFLFSTENAN